jgi:hypothetical protein
VAAIDPCLSCTSRLTVLDNPTGTGGMITFDELRRRNHARWQEVERT